MGLSSEMKNLSEDILASFKQRIKENEELIIEVQKTLDRFQKDHQDMATALRASLAKGEKNRLKEADIFMKKTVKDHQDMAADLRSDLAMNEKKRMKEFVALMKSINEKISEIFTYTDNLLAKSEVERLRDFVVLMKSINEEISEIFTYTHNLLETSEVQRLKEFTILIKSINEEVLRIFAYTHDMIKKGEVERLKEFNVVMTGIRNDVKNLKKAVAELIGDFAQDREEASVAWKKMTDILSQLRKAAVTVPMQVVKKEVKKETPIVVKAEVPVAVKAENPVAVEPEMEPKPEYPLTLEAKVLDIINKNPKGVKVSEMEGPLNETRMKLGFIAKTLLDEGKVQKVDNIYFPLNPQK